MDPTEDSSENIREGMVEVVNRWTQGEVLKFFFADVLFLRIRFHRVCGEHFQSARRQILIFVRKICKKYVPRASKVYKM